MPALLHPKQELYCQLRAQLKPQREAAVAAGYNAGSYGNLERHPAIKARIAELMAPAVAMVQAKSIDHVLMLGQAAENCLNAVTTSALKPKTADEALALVNAAVVAIKQMEVLQGRPSDRSEHNTNERSLSARVIEVFNVAAGEAAAKPSGS